MRTRTAAFAQALFEIPFYSAVDIGHPCHVALVSLVNPLFLSVATAVCHVLVLLARDCHQARESARTRRRLVSFTCTVRCKPERRCGAAAMAYSMGVPDAQRAAIFTSTEYRLPLAARAATKHTASAEATATPFACGACCFFSQQTIAETRSVTVQPTS
jgi:hypothetical protein